MGNVAATLWQRDDDDDGDAQRLYKLITTNN